MEEDELLFPEDNEESVPELEELGQGEHPCPEGGHLGRVGQLQTTGKLVEAVKTVEAVEAGETVKS